MKIKVLHSNVIYKRKPVEQKFSKDSLIFLPGSGDITTSNLGDLGFYGGGSQKYENVIAEVVATGDGALKSDGTRETMPDVKPGDLIVVDTQSGRSLDKEHSLCHGSEVWAVVEGYEDE